MQIIDHAILLYNEALPTLKWFGPVLLSIIKYCVEDHKLAPMLITIVICESMNKGSKGYTEIKDSLIQSSAFNCVSSHT